MKKIKHAVVLVNYKKSTDTIACVKSIEQCKDQPHIIVVDNGSTQGVVQELRDACPLIDIIASPVNVGFSAGNNLGIKKALKLGAQVVYILNNARSDLILPCLSLRCWENRIAGNRFTTPRL